MFKIKTATGKEFDSDFASVAGEIAIIAILNSTMATVMSVFSNPKELPIVGFEGYTTIKNVVNDNNVIKLILGK